ncbi:MAG TPA: cellulose-binding domain-containing protein, partial [Roseiflexaceae bacterium]|nr:cellulose-binding domain-containing protein [Roseiflexaceae bacterium]
MVSTPQRWRWQTMGLVLALVVLTAGSFSGVRGVWAQSAVSCSVVYTLVNQWDVGFQAEVKINNTGSTALNNWTVRWSFANGQVISQLWNGTHTQSGANVAVSNLSWNASIPAGGSQTVGFLASKGSTNTAPTAFSVNNTPCGGTPTAGPTATPTRTPTTGPTATPTRTPTAGPTPVPGTHLENPFDGAQFYLNVDYAASVNNAAT